MNWHILDVSSIWLKEFGSALSRQAPATCWSPVMRVAGAFENWSKEERLSNPPLSVRHFPLQRGYARWPISVLAQIGPRLSGRLLESIQDSGHDVGGESTLICTTPYYAPVAERWPGPVVYYQTDLTVEYDGVDQAQIRALDRRLCRVAHAVCPNSERIAAYMREQCGCDPEKITVVPNATRESNIYPACPQGPGEPPADLALLSRPFAGVIGNLAMNMDWIFLRKLVARTPEFTWVFVGPTSMEIHDSEQAKARAQLMAAGGRVFFTGKKSYGELQPYARAFDVAILPYLRKEPTYSGSSTRFYEHLAACRPMISTRGFEELLHKEPLLALVDGPEEAARRMKDLAGYGFIDGNEQARWLASRKGTWEERAQTVVQSVSGVCERSPELVLR